MTAQSFKKILKYLCATLLLLLLLAYLSTRLFLPTIIDKKFNQVYLSPPHNVSEKAYKIYQSLDFIADLHSDVLLWKRNINQKLDYGHEDIPRMIASNVALQAFTLVNKSPKNLNFDKNGSDSDELISLFMVQGRPVSSWFNLTQRVVVQSEELHRQAKASNGQLFIIKSKQDLINYLTIRKHNNQITATFIGIEGAHALTGKLENLDVVYHAGVRMIGLTHFFDNEVGGSAHGINKGGLTNFGQELIAEMEKKQVLIDLSHASEKLLDDVLSIASKPILISHSGVKGTCNNVRNLSDEHLIKIAKTGGIVGIAMFKQAICGTQTSDIAKAIKYTVDLIGSKHVALGSDFDGAVTTIFDVTGLPLIVDELLELEMSENDIRLIMGDNIKRILLENLPD